MTTTQLRRSSSERIIAGVAGGLAAMLKIDPVLVRIGFVALALLNGSGVLIYLAMWLIVPREDSVAAAPSDQVRENMNDIRESAESMVRRIRSYFATA